MVNKDALSRYRWIDERLRNKMLPPPTLEDILRYLSEKMGKQVSKRTLQKDIADMRYSGELNYQAPIEYSQASRTYHYSEEGYSISNMPVSEYDLQGLEIAISILEQFRNLPVISQFEDAILKIAASLKINRERLHQGNTLIRLETPSLYRGLEWITEIVEAMKQSRVLRISYQSFRRDAPTEHLVEPYHLREYLNRFYLVGKSTGSHPPRILTFALDRIIGVWQTGKTFDPTHFDDTEYFGDVLGISTSDTKPRLIELSFTPAQGKYIKSQPIHHSQRIVRDTRDQLIIRLKLAVNHELLMLLRSYGSQVRVIRPLDLASRIREEAEATLKLYQS
ncbi:MAG TPA: WYL domain-containing protein [Chitinophagaceae bacterium]|nr:WYL domain-containing protein [Chitinophagaceae bacterium]